MRLLRHVALDGDRLATAARNLRDHAVGAGLARRVVDDYRRALVRQRLRDARADPLRRPCYDRHFPFQFPRHVLRSSPGFPGSIVC